MSSRPMSYDSLRKILPYCEANKRIEMALRMPSIRGAERSVPLQIDDLFFDERAFYINQTKYEFGLYRHYETEEFPEFVESKNDVDVYGFEVDNWYRPLPGDFVMKAVDIDEPEPHDINTISEKEAEIEMLETRRYSINAKHKKLQANGNTFARLQFMASRQPEEIERCKSKLEKLRYELQCFYCLRDNTPTPFKPYLQLTTTSCMNYRYYSSYQRGTQKIESVEYKTTLPEAMKTVLKVILGNRRHIVYVNNMRITDDYIIRAPTDLKLKIQKLDISGSLNRVWSSVNSIIHSSSLPLRELSVDKYYANPPNLELEVARTAKKLVLKHESGEADWIPFLLSLQNQIVVEERSMQSVTEYMEIIRSWLENGKEVGTTFTFHIKEEKTVTAVMEKVVEQGLGTAEENGRVTIPMSGCSELQISYLKSGPEWWVEWILKFEVVNSIYGVFDDVDEPMNKLNIW